MGKTPKPLKIAIDASLGDQPWVAELRAKGHEVFETHYLEAYDLVLAPQACRWLPGMEFYLDEAIKGARKIKYPGKIKP